MEKIIKKWGDSHVVVIDPEDMKIYKLVTGDIISMIITKMGSSKDE